MSHIQIQISTIHNFYILSTTQSGGVEWGWERKWGEGAGRGEGLRSGGGDSMCHTPPSFARFTNYCYQDWYIFNETPGWLPDLSMSHERSFMNPFLPFSALSLF